MARPPMNLTFEDLRLLKEILSENPRFHAEAAEKADVERARLYRLIQRVNNYIGEKDLAWRQNGRFAAPPEVRRLIASFENFESAIFELAGAPRVSAGPAASLLLLRFVQEQEERVLGRFVLVLRSRQVAEALQRDEIDLALVHGESLRMKPDDQEAEVAPDIQATKVLTWQARIIQPRLGGNATVRAELEWEPGSLGDRLSQAAVITQRNPKKKQVRVQCRSFLDSIELVRRGLVRSSVVPDIYLARSEPDLVIKEPKEPKQGTLVMVYRKKESARWEWLLDTRSWQQLKLGAS